MINWAMEYWYLALAALLIGVATAAWIWLQLGAPAQDNLVDIDEPVRKGAAAPAPAPLEPGKPKIAAAVGNPDDLSLIKGVGPKLKALLTSLGVTRFDQVAAWGEADIAEVDQYLGSFKGRITRDSWVEQASFLATGDHAGFVAKFGAVGSENK